MKLIIALTSILLVLIAKASTIVGPIGGVTDTTATVFVRTDTTANVVLRYGTDPQLSTYGTVATTTGQSSDFTSQIVLGSLQPATAYYAQAVVDGVIDPTIISFKTFPLSSSTQDMKILVFTDFTTVSNLIESVATYVNAAAENPDFVFIGGDFDHRNPKTLGAKRKMFRELYTDSTPFMGDFVRLILRAFPIVHQWDDHDSGMNNIDSTYPNWNLTKQVFSEYVPSYPLPVGVGDWQKFRFAQIENFVLDCRSQRTPETAPDDSNKTMLGAEQLNWLESGLLQSTAQWKILFSDVITNTSTKCPDGWCGYQTEWNSLRDFIRNNNIKNVVIVSGDLHLAAIDNGAHNGGFPEMCVTQPNGNGGCPTAPPGTWSEGYNLALCEGYGTLEFTSSGSLTMKGKDENGNTLLSYTVQAQ